VFAKWAASDEDILDDDSAGHAQVMRAHEKTADVDFPRNQYREAGPFPSLAPRGRMPNVVSAEDRKMLEDLAAKQDHVNIPDPEMIVARVWLEWMMWRMGVDGAVLCDASERLVNASAEYNHTKESIWFYAVNYHNTFAIAHRLCVMTRPEEEA
jgi:hypothetical protein